MSYSFQVRAANKAAAKAEIAAEFDKVAQAQACHARDKAQALATFAAFVDLVDDDDTQDISVSCSGSLSGNWVGSDVTRITGANVSCGAGLVRREA